MTCIGLRCPLRPDPLNIGRAPGVHASQYVAWMDFGIVFANTGPFVEPDAAAAFASHAEAAGFESLWTVEHVVVPAGYESTYPYDPSGRMPGNDDAPIPDPLVWLSYLAAVTSRIRLATGILIVPQRNPLVLAKQLATLDALSGGRMEFGIGVGWLEEEFDALGVPFDDRGRRTDDYVAAMRALWADERATHHGEFASFDECVMRPQPRRGTIPVHVGGHSDAAARRAGRLGDGFFPGKGDHAELERLFGVARQAAFEAGRNPDVLTFTSGGNGAIGSRALDEVGELAAMGVTRVVLPSFLFWQDTEEALARYGAEIIAKAP
jgi:probable F420-dependent oxidoreductase